MRGPPLYPAHLLSNGRYSVLLSAACGGYSAHNGLALTRWSPDPTLDDAGFIIFVRDADSRRFWPAAGPPAAGYTFACNGATARFDSTIDGIDATLDITVTRVHDAELRRLVLRNRGEHERRLEVTSYAELALNSPGADAAHPAFSKLFVQTSRDDASGALLARRRARHPDDRRLVAAHMLGAGSPVEHETDRARFLGRGRSRTRPAALLCATPLSGTVGSVLDPIFALRQSLVLQPGEEVTLTAVLAAAANADDALATLKHVTSAAEIAQGFANASAPPAAAVESLGLPPRWCEQVTFEPATQIMATGGADTDTPAIGALADGRPSAAAPRVSAVPNRSGANREDPHGQEPGAAPRADPPHGDELLFFNGWGGFSADGTEYVIPVRREATGLRLPPAPWVNVMANEHAGCIVSESGATHSWAVNSRENRLTPWRNDPVSDPHGEALYIRDEETAAFWSPTPGPCPGEGDYEVRHGFGSTTFHHASTALEQQTIIFVPPDAPVRCAVVRLTNRGTATRHLTVYSYAQLVLGAHEADTRGRIVTSYDSTSGAVYATQPERPGFEQRVAIARSTGDGTPGWTTDRLEFLGPRGSVAAPAALVRGGLASRAGANLDACVVLARAITIEPGATVECAFVLGEAADKAAAHALADDFAKMTAVKASLDATRSAWADRLGRVQVRTPSRAIDIMVNGWLAYQNLSCRLWARSAFYQSGGAFGFRDQLQDSSALLYLDPAITRRQILLHAAHQFVEGDVLHWWHPPLSRGIRTRFSDDLLWLPYITAFYISRTGDVAILDEEVAYLAAPLLEPDEDEAFLTPQDSGTSGSLYDHCCRALDRSLTTGSHGLPLMGVGDWNDGMNRVGREGRGESVWLGFFLYDILEDFISICDARGDDARRVAYTTYRDQLHAALNDAGWDGAWYRRAYYDNGEPLGSAENDECRIDALAQAWAVLCGAAPADRAGQALDALERYLVAEGDGIIRLLTPAFDRTANDPGYIKGYLPGVRENGGQYTHGVLWAVRALAEHGRTERAAALLEMLTPIMRTASAELTARYRVEPYVIAADVYSEEPHVGRGGWTWYTGSAGWMFRIALESVLGVDIRRGSELALRPCVPSDWPGFTVALRLTDGTRYTIDVERTAGRSSVATDAAAAVEVEPDADGALLIPLTRDGGEHHLHITFGDGVGPRYRPR